MEKRRGGEEKSIAFFNFILRFVELRGNIVKSLDNAKRRGEIKRLG